MWLDDEFVPLVLRPNVCLHHLYRDADSVPRQLVCCHRHRGKLTQDRGAAEPICQTVKTYVVIRLSRNGQAVVTPHRSMIVSIVPLLAPFS